MGAIIQRVKKLKFTKKIFLITDAAGEIYDDEDQIAAISNTLKEQDIKYDDAVASHGN